MRVVSWNVNGLRAVEKKGFVNLAQTMRVDFLCLQEIKLQENQISDTLRCIPGYSSCYNCAEKKGYAGVAVYAAQKPDKIVTKIGHKRFDCEGRMLQLEYPNFTLINLYLPHGGRQKDKLAYKLECYEQLFRHLTKLRSKKIILAGDFNIAHTDLDLARPRQNRNNIMFTPEERQQLDRLEKLGFIDSFRTLHPEAQEYTWWPWLASARANNIGWRIDYGFINKNWEPRLQTARILREVSGSDHCPIELELTV